MARPVHLTGPQLRVLHEVLSIVMNDPDWSELTGQRDWDTLNRATETITAAHLAAAEEDAKGRS